MKCCYSQWMRWVFGGKKIKAVQKTKKKTQTEQEQEQEKLTTRAHQYENARTICECSRSEVFHRQAKRTTMRRDTQQAVLREQRNGHKQQCEQGKREPAHDSHDQDGPIDGPVQKQEAGAGDAAVGEHR